MPPMATGGYRDYVDDAGHMRAYADYQRRYADTLRESDRVLIELIRERSAPGAALLDMGCSTGNLLLHLSRLLPALRLHGADLVPEIVAACKADPALAGIEFTEHDMLDLRLDQRFDLITVNASLMFFTPEQFERALTRLGAALVPGGHLIGFDYVHPFEQEIELVETSAAFPGGLRLFQRSEGAVRAALAAAGFEAPAFGAFELGIDLPRPEDRADIRTWTPFPGASFRGTLFQPWCHFTATRA